MFSWFPMIGLAKTFAFSLICGFLGVVCAFKLALDLLSVAVSGRLDVSTEDDEGAYLVWPRDRFRISVGILVSLIFCVVFMGLSYFLALRAFANS